MKPDLDQWTSIFLAVSGTGIFLAAVLFLKARSKPIYGYPGLITAAFSVVLVEYVLYWSQYQLVYPQLIFVPNLILHFIAACIYLYACRLVNIDVGRYARWLFLPAALALSFNVLYWFGVFSPGLQTVRLPLSIRLLSFSINPWGVVGMFLLISALILVRSFSLNASSKQRIYAVLGFAGIFTIAYASYFILVGFSFFNENWDYAISFAMSLGIYSIGGLLILKPGWLEYTEPYEAEELTRAEVLSTASAESIFAEFQTIIQSKELHKRDDLRIDFLAREMGLPRNYLSYAINTCSGKNFNRFVNDIRLAEAEHLLKCNPDLPVKNIYFEVGFNNKASFYTSFKERYQCTPSEYRRQLTPD